MVLRRPGSSPELGDEGLVDLVTTALLIQVVLGHGHKIGLAVHVEADVSCDVPQKTFPIHNPRRNRQSGAGEHGSVLIVNRFDVFADERVRQIRSHCLTCPKRTLTDLYL